MVSRLKAMSLILVFMMLLPAYAISADKSLIFYILDGSGSMWGRVDGRLKIQVAKEVMNTFTKQAYHLEERPLKKPDIPTPLKTGSSTFRYPIIFPPVGGMNEVN